MNGSVALLILISSLFCALPSYAQSNANGCPTGSFTAITSDDGLVLSLLFDNFTVTSNQNEATVPFTNHRFCNLVIPLHLPPNHSLGVYKIDYRGFANLAAGQNSSLKVKYELGRRSGRGRVFQRQMRGSYMGDFLFTEHIGAGLMRRVGCGESSVLNLEIDLALSASHEDDEAVVSLDTLDSAPQGGIVYHFDLKRCQH